MPALLPEAAPPSLRPTSVGAPPARADAQGHRLLPYSGLVLFLALAWIPLLDNSPYADLSHWYTDHLHHSFATWVALRKGLFAVYTHPFREVWGGTGWPHPVRAWGEMPMAYPPGMFLVFLPLALLGATGWLSQTAFATVSLLAMLAIAAWSFQAVLTALARACPGERAATAALAAVLMAQLGLEGFYDAAFIGCGAWMILCRQRGRSDQALLWFSAAMLLHFRAVLLAPLALGALATGWRERKTQPFDSRVLTVALLSFGISATAFALMYPATAGLRLHSVRVASERNVQLVLLLSSAVLVALLARAGEWTALGVVLVTVALAEVELFNYWWHGAGVLLVPLAVGLGRNDGARTGWLRGPVLLWILLIYPAVWRDQPAQLVTEFVKFFRT